MFVCCRCTVDNSARVEAAVLLAPVGSDAGALWEVTHRGRLHVNDLNEQNEPHAHITSQDELWTPLRGALCDPVYSQPPAAAVPSSRCVVCFLSPPPPPRCICRKEMRWKGIVRQSPNLDLDSFGAEQVCEVFFWGGFFSAKCKSKI